MKRKILILICLILFISISAVSAADDSNQTLSASQSDAELIKSADAGTFADLSEIINNAENESEIALDKDYVYGGGDGEGINITKNITINGNGHMIDANHASRIFYIEYAATNVTLNNITFINGQAKSGGGAIYGENYNRALDRGCLDVVSDCPKTLELNGCTFMDCAAEYGGGAIDFDFGLVIKNCAFINNEASAGGAISGGGPIDYDDGLFDYGIVIKNCSFINNKARFAGAIHSTSYDTHVSIENSLFLNNSLWDDGSGGAIYFFCCGFDIKNSTFINNTAGYGGAIAGYESVIGSIEDSSFSGNRAGEGSTFHLRIYSEITVSNSNIDNPLDGTQIYTDFGSSGSYAYFINVSYDEFKNQSFSSWGTSVIAFGSILKVDCLVKTFGDKKRLYVTLYDNNYNPLKNMEISIEINGVTYTKTTDGDGVASIAVNLESGRYEVRVHFEGEYVKNSPLWYAPCENITHITINPSVHCESHMHKYCRDSQPFEARFLGIDGNFLTGGDASFNINGVFYKRSINSDGYAGLNINLDQGNYTITAVNPVTGEMMSCVIHISPTIIENHNLVKYYRNDSAYVVRLDGNGDLSGLKVTFNINGIFYERYSDEKGYVKLNINLEPGEYIITAEYNGCRVSNNITVLPVLKAEDLEMHYGDGSKFDVTLLNGEGKPFVGQNLTFNINGVFYTKMTDDNGIAQLNIRLMPGKYIITSTYNGANIANRVTVSN